MKLYKVSNYNDTKHQFVLCASMQEALDAGNSWVRNDPFGLSKIELLSDKAAVIIVEEKK